MDKKSFWIVVTVVLLSVILAGCDQERPPMTITFDGDYSEWVYSSSRADEQVDPIFRHSNAESIRFEVHTQNHHTDPESWYLSYSYPLNRTVNKIEFTYRSTFNDAGQQGRLILEIWDHSPRLIWSKEVEWDNSEGKQVVLEDLRVRDGIEFRWQRKDKIIYPGSLLEITDLTLHSE